MLTDILNKYGLIGVEALKQDVQKVSATRKTEQSIRYEVKLKDLITSLTFYGRQFFSTLETGRGPRKSSTYGGFDDSLLEYMKARGIGADLSEKKRKNLAKFIALKINREGDQTFKKGGRIVYSQTLTKLVDELTKAVKDDIRVYYAKRIVNGFKHT